MADRDDRPERRQRSAYAFHCDIPTRFGDMDVQAHINNVAIARFYEEARVQFHRARLGLAPAPRTDEWSTVVAAINIAFLKEVPYPSTVTVGVAIGRVGRTSFTVVMGLFLGEDCVGLCETVTVIVAHGGPLELPAEIREQLAAAAFKER
jgi:acyl-CoA thioester hydrolase